jgi:hypothetical protein
VESGTGVVADDDHGVKVASRPGNWLAGADQKRLSGICNCRAQKASVASVHRRTAPSGKTRTFAPEDRAACCSCSSIAKSARSPAFRGRWIRVISPTQPVGFITSFTRMFKKMLATLATTSATNLNLLWINKPGSARAAAMPNQAESGNSTPADNNGDAQPMMHSGGIEVSVSATAADHGREIPVESSTKTRALIEVCRPSPHMKTALASFDGQ